MDQEQLSFTSEKMLHRFNGISESIETTAAHDFTGWTTLHGLDPDTEYVASVFIDGNPAGVPATFHTLPDSNALRDQKHNPRGLFNFSFTFGSCANQNPLHGIGPSLPTYATFLDKHADEVDFQIMNGDWLYEELRTTPVDVWAEKQGVDGEQLPEVVRDMPTIVGVWENYKLYLDRGTNLSAWHRKVPGFFTFDDHELVNDIWGAGSTGRRNRRAVFRDIGTRAWLDYLGWANPAAYPHTVHHGQATLTAESDVLVDPEADFTSLPLDEMLNLHVHWGTPEAGVNDLRYDDDALGDPNSRVYEIREVLDKHRVRIFPVPSLQMETFITQLVAAAMEVSVSPTVSFFCLIPVVPGKCMIQAVRTSRTSPCSVWISESGLWRVWTRVTLTFSLLCRPCPL